MIDGAVYCPRDSWRCCKCFGREKKEEKVGRKRILVREPKSGEKPKCRHLAAECWCCGKMRRAELYDKNAKCKDCEYAKDERPEDDRAMQALRDAYARAKQK